MKVLLKENKFKSIKRSNPKIYVLGCVGRSGINFLHSKLDSHPEILIMPDLSFFRSIYGFKNSRFYKNTCSADENKFCKYFVNYLYSNRKNDLEKEFLFSKKQRKDFLESIYKYIDKNKKYKFYTRLFYAFHYAFAEIRKININNIKVIISHEHSSHFLQEYFKYIRNVRFIIMVRNPISIFAGLKFFNISRYKKHPPISLDFHIGQIFSIIKFLKNNKSIIIKNEIMNKNVNYFLEKLEKKLGVKKTNVIKKSTYLGKKWRGDSAYLMSYSFSRHYQTQKKTPKNFHLEKNQLKRNLKILDEREIILTEVLLKSIYKKFNYNFIIKDSLAKSIKGYFYYFTIYNQREDLNKNLINYIKCCLRRILLLFNFRKIYFWLGIS